MDIGMLKSLMGKKAGKMEELDQTYKDAKMGVLKDLHSHMGKMLGEDLQSGLKKVTVAAPDEEGLEKGLDTAKDLVEELPEQEMENSEEELSPEELQSKIDELTALLAKKKK